MFFLRSSILSLLFLISSCHPVLAFKVGLVLDKGGKDDKSFNTSAFEGATKAEKDLGIELKYVEAMDDAAFESIHRSMANKNFDLIIGIGFSQIDPITKVASQFPSKHFAIVDGEVKKENVRSLMFEEHEGSYLMGAIAAMKAKTAVGFLGGMDVPLIRRFELGFKEGVKKINPKLKVVSNFVGITSEAWNNPAKGKELALAQYNSGVDVIFVAAGASGLGAFDAAEEKKKLAIGVDSNQNWIKPGLILTSMLKRVDLAVYNTIKDAKNGQFKGGIIRYGLKDKGVDYALDSNNKSIFDQNMIKKSEEIKQQIISQKIIVPDFYLLKK